MLSSLPRIEAVISASKALLTSRNFKRVLEVILAFGNYMNSAKRGAAYEPALNKKKKKKEEEKKKKKKK